MGNIGGPSTGCQECRQRKVKCDETKPECSRCKNAGRRCSGYRDNFNSRFIHVTGIGSKRKYQRRNPTTTSSDASSESSGRNSASPAERLAELKISTHVDASIFEICHLMFDAFYTNSSHPNTSLGSSLNYFITTIHDSAEDSSARLALSAAYRSFFSFVFQNREMEELSQRDFTTSVSQARAALDDPEERKSDVTLFTVFLLTVHENIECGKALRSPLPTHYFGLIHLLRLRGFESLNTSISKLFIRQFYERFTSTVLYGSLSEMTELLDAALLLPPSYNEHSTTFPVSSVVSLARLRLRVEKVGIFSNLDVSTVEDILSTASQLDKELSRYPDHVPPSGQPKRSHSPISENGASTNYPGWTDTYPSLASAQDWNYYRYQRIVLNMFISRCAALLRKYSLAASADQVCDQMVDEVCASVLFYTGALQKHFESFRNDPHFVPEDMHDRSYASGAIGIMFFRPKLHWLVKWYPWLKPKQREWLEWHLDNIVHLLKPQTSSPQDDPIAE